MRLKGAPPEGEIALSYVNKPTGSLVGSSQRPTGHLLALPGQSGPRGAKGEPGTTIAGVDGLQDELDAKAVDTTVVHKAGDETITGVKTFDAAVDLAGHKIQHLAAGTVSTDAVNKSQLDLKQDLSEKGQANGYAGLDGGGKVPITQLPSSIMEYQGVWNASTNSPTLANGTGNTGDVYRVGTAAARNLGSGSITFDVGDYVIYNGTTWEKSDTTDAVASVAGKTGNVTLNTGDVPEDATSLYYTAARSTLKADKARIISAGTGLTGGGDLSADRALAVDFGSAAGKVCQGNDSRLSDTRTPTNGTVTAAKLATTGTPDGSKFLRDDMNWSALSSLATTVNLKGTYASLPSAGQDGRLYECTDVGLILRDNGTTWEPVWIGDTPPNILALPPTTGWTSVNMGTATASADKGSWLINAPSQAGEALRAQVRTLSPSSGYTASFYLNLAALENVSQWHGGIVLYDSVGGKFVSFGISYNSADNAATAAIKSQKWNSASSVSANYAVRATATALSVPRWLRFRDDGTTRYLEYSLNGLDWVTHFSVGRTDWVTPNSVGIFAQNTNGAPMQVRCRSMLVA